MWSKIEFELITAGGKITINRIHRSLNSEGTLTHNCGVRQKVGIINMPINYSTTMLTDFYQFQKNPVGGYEGLPKVRPVNHPALFSIYLWKAPIKKHSMVLLLDFPGGGPEHIRSL